MLVAGYGVTAKVIMIVTLIGIGIGSGVQPFLGYCYGAKNKERLTAGLRFTFVFGLALCFAISTLCYIFAEPIVKIFLTDTTALNAGIHFTRILMTTGWLIGPFIICQNTLQAMGAATPALSATVIRQGVIFVPAMRIFGVQDNRLESIDVSEMPSCQGIDAGMNRLTEIDVSHNPELVELYINDNGFTEIDLSYNPKLKYFYCHNNHISELNTRANPLLRHINSTGNPMKSIRSLAPQREEELPLELYAGDGGCVGLKFNPIYNAQWRETGQWQQSYYAYPNKGYRFVGWYENGEKVSEEETWIDEYGTSRILNAVFEREKNI